jgi:hypothetical protein
MPDVPPHTAVSALISEAGIPASFVLWRFSIIFAALKSKRKKGPDFSSPLQNQFLG